jgi:sec-independent protein translocase protein TatB
MGTPPIQMANLGMADSLILMVMALVVFGPRRLPQIGRQIGKLMYEFRKASNDFKFQMEEELRNAEDADRRKQEEERLRTLAVTPEAPKLSAPEAMASLLPSSSIDSTTAAVDAAASPYPNEVAYPPMITEPSEVPAEETLPRIQPPSTGEQVAAARPNSLEALGQAATEQGAAASTEAETAATPESSAADAMVSEGAPVEPSAPEAEQAAHHG